MTIDEILDQNPVMPVVTVQNETISVEIARALQSAGVHAIEITLRTGAGVAAISAIRRAVPDILVGAGTVRRPEDFGVINAAGAQFAVSPGTTGELLDEAENWDIPYLPAASTVSEMMNLSSQGYGTMKFFPAESFGGTEAIQAISGPLGDIRLCVSGGVNQDNFRNYLALPNVVAVSGSWLTPVELIAAGDWAMLTRHVSECLAMGVND